MQGTYAWLTGCTILKSERSACHAEALAKAEGLSFAPRFNAGIVVTIQLETVSTVSRIVGHEAYEFLSQPPMI